MLLQFRYQRAKLYRQVAMGTKHHLSVSQGDLANLIGQPLVYNHDAFLLLDMKISDMKVLLLCLLLVYLFQFYNGYTLLKLWLWSPSLDCSYIQVISL